MEEQEQGPLEAKIKSTRSNLSFRQAKKDLLRSTQTTCGRPSS